MEESKAGASRIRKSRAASILALEPLEGRMLMTAVPSKIGIQEATSTSGGSTLVITGTNKADVIAIADNGTGQAGNITVTLGSGTTYTSKAAVNLIEVAGNAGNDQVSYNLNGPLLAPESVLVDLGAGNDRFVANINGVINTSGELDLEAYGDSGNDNLVVNQPGATQAGTFVPYLDGGTGNDTLTYNGTGTIGAGASVSPEFSGGAGNDTIRSTYSGVVNGNYMYNLSVDGGAGNDNIFDTVNLAAGSTGSVGTSSATPAAVEGGSGNDHVQFAVNVDPNASPDVNAVVIGGTGKDVVQHTSNVLSDKSNETDTIIA